MNLSDLTPDAKFSLAKDLPVNDLLSLCSTDRNMRNLCMSDRFNSIWSKRLKEDFNIDYQGSNGYMEYLLTTYQMKQKYYAAIFYDALGREIDDIYLCKTRDEGYEIITENLEKRGFKRAYIEVKTVLNALGELEIERVLRVWLQEITFAKNSEMEHKNKYDITVRQIAELLFPDNIDDQEDFIKYGFEEAAERATLNSGELRSDVVIQELMNMHYPNIENNEAILKLLGTLW